MTQKQSKMTPLPSAVVTIEPLLREILRTLAAHGGAAHRDQVVRSLLGRAAGAPLSEGARARIIATFERYLAVAETLSTPHPFAHRPFGAESRRWALTETGRRTVFQSAGAAP
jgi:hypothetical protein